MPILTNLLSLPEPLVRAVANDSYTPGEKCDYSTTQLLKPARIVALQRKWREHLTEDASERIFSLIGQAIHTILERGASDRYLVEKRFYSAFAGKRISGQIDVFDTETGILSDYKLTSRFTTGDGVKPEWQQQASINALLMSMAGIEINGAQIVAIYRDWSKMAANRKQDYPERQVQVFTVPLWSADKTIAFIEARITAHEAAKAELPMCSEKERWAKPEKWALMQNGRKKALKLYLSETEATAAVTDDKKQFVEHRPGENTRCLFYCSVNKYCSFYQELMNEQR